jgi:hypothetical protein
VDRTSATKNSAWPFVLAVFAASRLLFMGTGALAAAFLPWAEPGGKPLEQPGFLSYWAHWDGAWYSEIATEGYWARDPASTAFFPLFPLLVRFGALFGGGPAVWGVLISLFSTLFALFFFYRIAGDLFDERVARASTVVLAFFPTAFYLNAVYTEALFLAFTTGSIWAARVRKNMLLAAVFGALAAATRNLGVVLVLPLLFEWWWERRRYGTGGLAAIGIVPAGLLGYVAYLWAGFGDPLVFYKQQEEYWGRVPANPLDTIRVAWATANEGLVHILNPGSLFFDTSAAPALETSNTLNLLFLVLLLVVVGMGFALLPPGLSTYAFLMAFLPLIAPSPVFPLMSLPRFMLGAFPVFLVLGYLVSRRRAVLVPWLIFSVALGVALAAMFATWRWVA